MSAAHEVTVDRDVCVGAGQCVMHAPEVFDQDLNGVVTLRTTDAGADVWEYVLEAAERCPVKAITVPGT
ncbi:ferredoxin [Micromonospora sp. WMMC241]|uniref:ferredoxin n=1 Tax=Micromonospora sp. WMMC241 TaxID=3015159 RepID=UPI0022B6E912|nr:ferredoxin [Micromonospora sp. WMMC241]MCZ7440041.1 ferredoxin [Micromonospora sp. WMMC241]